MHKFGTLDQYRPNIIKQNKNNFRKTNGCPQGDHLVKKNSSWFRVGTA